MRRVEGRCAWRNEQGCTEAVNTDIRIVLACDVQSGHETLDFFLKLLEIGPAECRALLLL